MIIIHTSHFSRLNNKGGVVIYVVGAASPYFCWCLWVTRSPGNFLALFGDGPPGRNHQIVTYKPHYEEAKTKMCSKITHRAEKNRCGGYATFWGFGKNPHENAGFWQNSIKSA